MKTIEITEEVYAKLIELANEMTTQDMRGTRMPHMFQIRDWKKVYNGEMNSETKIWLDRGNGIEIETFEELVDYLQNYDIKFDEKYVDRCTDFDFYPYEVDNLKIGSEHLEKICAKKGKKN